MLFLIYFFADDSCMFFEASAREAEVMKGTLVDYERVSKQFINLNKSIVRFNRNCNLTIREDVVRILGVREAKSFEKYLGLPTEVGQNKQGGGFPYVKERMWKMVNN